MLDEFNPAPSRYLWKIARAVLLVFLIMIGLFAFAQRSMIYFPSKESAENLKSEAASSNLIPWNNPAGELIGYRTPPLNSSPLPPLSILLLHGNAGYALHRSPYVSILQNALPNHAVSIFFLEYPGYGSRGGSPSQSALIDAAENALDALPPDAPIILVGESIGTGVASAVASHHPNRIHGLLLLTPFDSLASAAQYHYPLLPVRWILLDKFPSIEWLRNVHCPISFVLAENDSIVPPDLGRSLYRSYQGPKSLFIASNADHNDLLATITPEEWQSILKPLAP